MKDLRDSKDLTIHGVQPINTHAAKQVQQEEKTLILLQAINDPDTMLAQAGSPGGSPHENKRHALVRPQPETGYNEGCNERLAHSGGGCGLPGPVRLISSRRLSRCGRVRHF